MTVAHYERRFLPFGLWKTVVQVVSSLRSFDPRTHPCSRIVSNYVQDISFSVITHLALHFH